jgi:hypothetical protein
MSETVNYQGGAPDALFIKNRGKLREYVMSTAKAVVPVVTKSENTIHNAPAAPAAPATTEVVVGPKLHNPSEVNVDALVSQVSSTMKTLEEQREYHQTKIDDIDKAMDELREKFGVTTVMPRKKAITRVVTPTASGEIVVNPTGGGRGTGARGDNQYTIPEAVCEVLRRVPFPRGLSRGDIASKILGELGYKTTSDPADFSASVYTGGINKLVKEGAVEVIGQRPNTTYRLKR